jgi:hypothetical protein
MDKKSQDAGIELLIEKYRAAFRIPENLNHYSEADYKIAERKFVKYLLIYQTHEKRQPARR